MGIHRYQASRLDKVYQWAFYYGYRLKLIYNFIVRPKIEGAYVAVWHNNSVLIIKNSYKNYYTFPCGGVNNNETPLQAAKRELNEEVNIWAKEQDFVFVRNYFSSIEYMDDKIFLYELVLLDKPDFQCDNREVIKAEFRTIESALKLPLFPAVKKYLMSKI